MTLAAPLWLMIAIGPSWGATSMNIVEKLSTAPLAKLAVPCAFGPTTRMPLALATVTSSCCRWRPASPVSAKPDAMMTAALTPAAPHWRTCSSVASPDTAITTASGVLPIASSVG
ncbi:hypothetical protein D3C85_1474780 [compost metagenome]